jgi:hypothetical protein
MKIRSSLLLLVGATALGAMATAKIVRLDLPTMVQSTDDAVYGTIVDKETFRVDHPVDGPELYYTTLFVQGRSLETGQNRTAAVTFPGGWMDADQGVWNSEAPSEDDTRLGNKVVVFSKWSDNMGGDVAASALFASHGGLFRTFEGPSGTVVQGRGDGYAISTNIRLTALDNQITQLAQTQRK